MKIFKDKQAEDNKDSYPDYLLGIAIRSTLKFNGLKCCHEYNYYNREYFYNDSSSSRRTSQTHIVLN